MEQQSDREETVKPQVGTSDDSGPECGQVIRVDGL